MTDYSNTAFDNFSKDIKQKLQYLIKNLQSNKSNTDVTIKLEDNFAENSSSSYQQEIDKYKELINTSQKFQASKTQMLQAISDSSEKQNLENLSENYEQTSSLLEQLGLDSSEFSNIFTSAFDDVVTKSQSFSDSMKNMLDDLKNYFIKTIAKAITDSLIGSSQAESLTNSIISTDSNGGMINAFGILKSFLGIFSAGTISSHHSGGIIPSGSSYSLPGTNEYLALLKGGERVLSPAENADYSSPSTGQNQVVVNNFNIKSWDSKDVQKYLLDNKNLIAGITADNIKYNNANLRYMIGGA